MVRKTIISILFLSSISMVVGMPQVLSIFFGFIQVFVLSGHVVLLFLKDKRREWFDDLVISLLISPIMMVVSTLVLVRFTGSIERAFHISLYIFYLLLALAVVLRRTEAPENDDNRTGMISAFCIGFAVLAGLSYLLNPTLIRQGDAWYHASLVSGLSTRGFPPTEPLLADFPLQYMWYYHLFISLFVAKTKVSVFQGMATFNVVVAFIFPYLVARYTMWFTENRRRQIAMILLSLSGLASMLWVFWPVELLRAFVGEVRFTDEIGRILSNIRLTDAKVIFTLAPYGTHMVNLLDKFLTITVFGYSLSLYMWCFLILLRRVGTPRRIGWGEYILLGVCILGTLIFHVVTGMALVCSIFGFAFLSRILPGSLRRYRTTLRDSIAPVAVLSLAMIVAVPFFRWMNLGSGSGEAEGIWKYFGLNFMNFFTIAVPLLLFACYAWKKVKDGEPDEVVALSCWVLPLLALCLFVELPSVNEGKFIFPLFLIIGPPVFLRTLRLIDSLRGFKKKSLIIVLLVLFFPPPALTYSGFINNKPRVEPEIRRFNIDELDRDLFSWIRENTGTEAVFIENNDSHLIPVYTGRRSYYSNRGIIEVLGYDKEKLSSYRQTVADLYSPEALPARTIETLRGSTSDIYILLWAEDKKGAPLLSGRFREHPESFRFVYGNEKVELFRVIPADTGN